MSLVDYASSSDDDAPEVSEQHKDKEPQHQHDPPSPPPTQTKFGSSSDLQPQKLPPSIEKLPDASLLLNSPDVSSSNLMNASDHFSRVAAALVENATRKRDSNGMASSSLRSKVPRGNLSRSRNVPDTPAGAMLVPPQISGRSNVVTEDIGKLFVKKHDEPSAR